MQTQQASAFSRVRPCNKFVKAISTRRGFVLKVIVLVRLLGNKQVLLSFMQNLPRLQQTVTHCAANWLSVCRIFSSSCFSGKQPAREKLNILLSVSVSVPACLTACLPLSLSLSLSLCVRACVCAHAHMCVFTAAVT